MKAYTIRFPEEQIIWISNTLYKVNSPEGEYYTLPLDFDGYDQIIGLYYKTPGHFYFKAQLILNFILRHYLHELIWDATTGYINIEASGKYLYVEVFYSDFHTSPTTAKKILSILEELSVVKILEKEKKDKAIHLKLYLQRFNEFLKKGTERWNEANKILCEMNDVDFEGIEYGGVA